MLDKITTTTRITKHIEAQETTEDRRQALWIGVFCAVFQKELKTLGKNYKDSVIDASAMADVALEQFDEQFEEEYEEETEED